MDYVNFLKQRLYLQGIPVYENDITHIHNIIYTINQAQSSLRTFPHLNQEVPITIVDKELML
ncbi:hypothetical protein ABRT01_00630 [Lentibacillus sp. L22]|uniref:hypothetical protein n=1 Tax=Lentibacillus TaxID=175304 RepID=UPI0022B097F0|nr:hypothetical protein [Lentibacillus daqui]